MVLYPRRVQSDARDQATKPGVRDERLAGGHRGLDYEFHGRNGDEADARFGRDDLLTNIMIYWLTETAPSSFRVYNQNAMQPPTIKGKNTNVPVAVASEAPIPGGVRLPREMGGPPDIGSTTWRTRSISRPGRILASLSATSASSRRSCRADRGSRPELHGRVNGRITVTDIK
ncbi:hypothetical protein [Mesorhizobium sp. WSM2561]|uniref:hypothetical protein n=1 Tax=Mesorhizobium sp. WSM2561 TaxID=1040985 RepID=UPI0018DCA517|nr:hypothetical protein [Mesorhizobium sp. WSM2561]